MSEAVRLCHPTEHSSLSPNKFGANTAHLTNKTSSAQKEKEMKACMSPRIAEVFKDKRLCLLKKILIDEGHGPQLWSPS